MTGKNAGVTFDLLMCCGVLVQACEPGVSSSGLFRRKRGGQRNPAEPAEPAHGPHLDRLALRHAAVSLQVSVCLPFSHPAPLQPITRLPCSHRTQPNTLWLVDSEGEELEEIPLDSEGYCAYSATGTATVTMETAHTPVQRISSVF